MYLRSQVLVPPGGSMRPIECSSIDAVVGQQLLHLGEELDVVGDADMLEHADRDDAVVAAGLLAVVEQLEAHPVGDAALERAPAARRRAAPWRA